MSKHPPSSPDLLQEVVTHSIPHLGAHPSEISERFIEMCRDAEKMESLHHKAAKWCKLQKDIHTFVALVAGLIASSVLFGLLGDIAPQTVKWIGAVLALLSAYCAAFNVYWRFPERESNHSNAAKRLRAFAKSCEFTMKEYESGFINKKEFRILLEHHDRDREIITSESPNVSIES
jgi:hypothetical protein